MHCVSKLLAMFLAKVFFFQVVGEDLLIQDSSSSEIVPFHRSSFIKEGIPGELHPRTMPMIMKHIDAEAAAAICHKDGEILISII